MNRRTFASSALAVTGAALFSRPGRKEPGKDGEEAVIRAYRDADGF